MTQLPLNLTAFGVQSDKLADNFCIYFLSSHTNVKLYLAEEELTEDISKALWSDDMSFVTSELTKLLQDSDFLDYLQASLIYTL